MSSPLVYVIGGSCLTNAIPHLVSGVSGRSFPSLFSSPIGVGLSSPVVNFIWGFSNLVLAYYFLIRLGKFSIHELKHVVPTAAGSFLLGLSLAYHFGSLNL